MDITLHGFSWAILLQVLAIAICGFVIGARGAVVATGISVWLALVTLTVHFIIK
ncbi:hypothetical protein H8F21_14090 [Pseudomonas sp. P66]|uniref:Uncharacterized protein n=1 Tax=Pseudomonas arcuscaelestis TaxID=2710591 RepID=A0ABS2BYY5_9PSED|nr:hypothetical protein [Pseudomonas arcuscaelestis]MBM5458695.1 hypothetical protein [Pseudomonas arcuscaelestis]